MAPAEPRGRPVRSRPVTATSKENEPGRQSLLFSATFPPNVQALAARLVMAPGLGSGLYGNVVSDSSQSPTPAKVAVGKIGGRRRVNITQRLLLSDHLRERKMESLIAVLRSRPLERRTLVFVAAKTDAKWVRAKLQLAAEADERAARAASAASSSSSANASDSNSAVAGSIPDPTLFSADELHGDCRRRFARAVARARFRRRARPSEFSSPPTSRPAAWTSPTSATSSTSTCRPIRAISTRTCTA